MLVIDNCKHVAKRIGASLEEPLSAAERTAIEAHLAGCPACREKVKRFRAVAGVLDETFTGCRVSEDFAIKTSKKLQAVAAEKQVFLELEPAEQPRTLLTMLAGFGGLPWWGVSLALHVLVIALAGLISMSIELPKPEDSVVVVTELQPRTEIANAEQEKAKSELKSPLESKHETPPTDPTSKEASDIVVPPDILAKAELGDHFETINPDRPDTHSAFGNPDSHMFYSVKGCDEPEGGGGTGGASLDDVVGVGGASSPGTGGGWGGGNGTGIGVGNGSGRGSFGTRNGGGRRLMVKRHGGSQATESSVDLALRWLAYHQEPDGHWDVKKYGGAAGGDAGITGLALLAFLGAGHTEKVGQFRDNVKRAITWIISKQEADGSIGKEFKEWWHPGYSYHHAICGLALAEAAGMARVQTTVEAAQKAVDYTTETHQGGEGSDKTAWRYEPKKDIDSSVSGWFVMQMKSAKIAGLKVNPMSFEGALRYYDSIEDKKEFNGYTGGRFPYQKGGQPALNTSAIGILCNLFLGRKATALTGGAEYLAQNLPAWDKTLGKGGVNASCFPMYYTYYGTLSMFQLGSDYWKKWNEAMKQMLLPTQCKNGDDAGSWDPLGGADDKLGGRVYMTATGALCLEIYYRYMKLDAGR